jgi:hypothetical protein
LRRRQNLEESALGPNLLRQRLRDGGPVAIEVPRQQCFELAIAVRQALEPLGEGARGRVKIAPQKARESRRRFAGVRRQGFPHRRQHAVGLALDRLTIECTACLA